MYRDRLLGLLDPDGSLSKRVVPERGLVLGETQPVPWRKFRHHLYAPLTVEEIETIQNTVRHTIHSDLREFYGECNGVDLFGGSLCVDGLRRTYGRTGKDATVQPFDMRTFNIDERTSEAPADLLFIGSYRADGCRAAIQDGSGRIIRTPRERFVCLEAWPDFKTFLFSEAERLQRELG